MEIQSHHSLQPRIASDETVVDPSSTVHIVNFAELDESQKNVVAAWLHERTKLVENMLTVSEKEVHDRFLGLVALRQMDELESSWEIAGYIGSMKPEKNARSTTGSKFNHKIMAEVGSLFVDPAYRSHIMSVEDELNNRQSTTGTLLSRALVQRATELLAEENGSESIVPYAFCNKGSLAVFKDTGYEEATLSDVPETASELCRGCALFDQCHPENCCDTIVIYDTSTSQPHHTSA